ncbi:gamma-glutamyltransferase [Gemmatimonadota bacterium]
MRAKSSLMIVTAISIFCSIVVTPLEAATRYMMGQTRSVVRAPNGMVATSQPLAVEAGLRILKEGGNAIDAAVAASAALGLIEPASCGIGGDLFVIYWDNATQKLYGLNASGHSPYGINIEKVRKLIDTETIPVRNPLAWSVPGCVDGWDMLLKRFGTMSFAQVLKPAIEYAEKGFPVNSWVDPEDPLLERKEFRETYLPEGKPLKPGAVFINPGLAWCFRQIAENGRDAFYKGSITERIVKYSEKVGGFFSMKDFAEHEGEWVTPVSTNYRGYDVWELPPNGQGIAVLQMLNILEGHNLASLGHNSAEYLHLLIEAKKLAFADRARFYADPDFYKTPLDWLISKEYGAQRRSLINPDKARMDDPPGEPPEHGETIYMSVADKDRNMVSFIQSIYWGWGSGYVPENLGFCLQNRGASFALDPEHANSLQPNKRPFHTIIPGFVTENGEPWLCFGVMGGPMQPQGQVQVLCNIIDFGMNIQEAGDAPRFRHFGSSQPDGTKMVQGGTVGFELGIDREVVRKLTSKGHSIHPSLQIFCGGYQAIMLDPVSGMLHGASDPRREGCAFGY